MTVRDCGFRAGSQRSVLGGNPDFRYITAASVVQSAKAGRDLLLQYGSDKAGVVKHLASLGRTLQSGQPPSLASTDIAGLLP